MGLRVLTFLHSFGPGGVERDALRLLPALAATGLETPIVIGRLNGTRPAGNFDLHPLDGASDRTQSFETLWMIAKLPAQIRRLKPDVLFCPGNAYSVVAVAMKLWMGRRCPPVVIKISNDLQRRDMPLPIRAAYHLWVRLQLRLFDSIIAMAPAAIHEIAQVGHIPPSRITLIRNPCFTSQQLAKFAKTAENRITSPDRFRFLSIGRLAPQKNFSLLLKAFAQMPASNDTLTIVGEGRERTKLAALAARLGIADRVSFPGETSDITKNLTQADAFVLASDYEGLGVVLLEALAAGLPIVTTDSSVNINSLVGPHGDVVPRKDATALAAAMTAAKKRQIDHDAQLETARAFTVEAGLEAHRNLFAKAASAAPRKTVVKMPY